MTDHHRARMTKEVLDIEPAGTASCWIGNWAPCYHSGMESSPNPQADYDQLVRLLETFPEAAGPLIDANGVAPAAGSQVEREMREVPDGEALRDFALARSAGP